MARLKQGEILKRDMRTKSIYHFVDSQRNIDIKCKEVFKRSQKVVHYPFNTNTGRKKYNSIEKITYENFPQPLPAGFIKSYTRGYGFTRELAPILYSLQDALSQLKHVVVSPDQSSQIVGRTKVVLSLNDLKVARPKIASLLTKHKAERETLATNILSDIFPQEFTRQRVTYRKGQLSAFVSQYDLTPELLSSDDLGSIGALFDLIPSGHEFLKQQGILVTKQSIDRIFVQDIVERYEKLYAQTTDTDALEDKWQDFFRDNILYFNFGYRECFEKERIQGDKKLDIPDFIMLSTYGYLDVFEIKTHLTQLLTFDKGRKNFHWSAEASRAISQAENYIDAITKEEDTIIKNIRDEYDIHTVDAVRPFVYIIASSDPRLAGSKTNEKYRGRLKAKMRNDFRRLSNSLKNIDFLMYDQLLEVFKNTLKRLRVDR